MYLYLGQNIVVRKQDIIGFFDLDNCTGSKRTREYLARAEKAGAVVDVSGELPKTFALSVPKGGGQTIYLSQLAPSTLLRRWNARPNALA